MHHQRCVCPKCGVPLRVKDRSYLGRPVPCPDCRSRLILTVADNEQLQVTLVDMPADAASNSSTEPTTSASTGHSAFTSAGTRVRVISWGAALLVAGLVAVLVWRPWTASKPVVAQAEQDAALVEEGDSLPVPANSVDDEGAMGDEMPSISFESNRQDTDPQEVVSEQPDAADPTAVNSPEPLDALPLAEPSAMPEKPVPAVVVEPPPFDFDKAFAQPLQRFRQSESVSRSELLELLSELVGAPIRYEDEQLGARVAGLKQKISLDLSDTTVGQVLDKVLEETGIVYERERDGLRLRPADGANADAAERSL